MPNLPRDLILGFAVAALALYACIVTTQRNRLEVVCEQAIANTVRAEARADRAEREIQFLYMLQDIAFCESSLEHDAENGSAYGIFQFKRATFDWMSDILDMRGLDYNLPKHQWVLAEEAFRRGLGTHWECCTKSEECLAYTKAVREGR